MSKVCVDYLDTYRRFFDRFASTVDPNDQLPVKVAGYNLVECEITGAVADWALQYLEQRRCPPFLIAHLIRKVVEEVRVLSKVDPISCGFRDDLGDFLSLKLMKVCIAKLVEVCSRYRDNAELSSLPPPYPLPPVTSCAIKNSRRSMEDRHVAIHDFHTLFNIKGWGPASYYGVLDGHNGIDAAIYSVSHLHQYLAESPHYPADPIRALHEACCRTDDLFTMKAEKENLHGGTTAVVALLRPRDRKLYIAWIGDSQAVLVRQGRPIQIVRPHKPDRPDEKDRIERLGGAVVYWGAWRVNGQLAVSRAIGDAEYKPYVTAKPDIEEITLDGTEDFLILACDGLWDFVTEEQATSAVYKQLRENPEDLEAVSHRLVALSKEQSSQDNISVVVVFLTDPAELAKRPPMETPIPNPFNGAEMFNGQHHRSPGHPAAFDDEDFGPETDVDMVDDVLLSPAISAAKSLVHDDDYERQRQQMKEFDDPGDLEKSRDTPTPPAHEVARDVSGDNLAESGGEESEEEWNYIPGNDKQNQPSEQAESKQDDEDMNSQLNPNAAEFVPVSPKRLLMDDPVIASSPAHGFEKSLDNVPLPSELEFSCEISQRPGDLEYSNGPKNGDDFLGNLSTLHKNGEGFNGSSVCSELAGAALVNLSEKHQDIVSFDKFAAFQNMEEKVTSAVLEKANLFGESNEFSNNAFEATNIFDKSDPMTASFMGKELPSSPEYEDNIVPGTPRSTTVEAPSSPTADEISPAVHHTELDSPVDDFAADTQKSPDLISPGDGPHDGITSAQERTSSSGFESESGADDNEPNAVCGEGFSTEYRKSPIDVNLESNQSFGNTNPFDTLQQPLISPIGQSDASEELREESPLENQKKDFGIDQLEDQIDFMSNAVSSPIEAGLETVPFNQLGFPKDNPEMFLCVCPPKPSETQDDVETLSPVRPDDFMTANYQTNVNDVTQNLFSDDTNPEIEETSFTIEDSQVNEASHVDLDTTEGFLETESKIVQDSLDCEQLSKLDKDLEISHGISEAEVTIPSPVSPKAVEKVLAAFDDIKLDEHEREVRNESQDFTRDLDIEAETKEMKLEFESHISDSHTTPEELKNVEEGFEVINKDELSQDIDHKENLRKESELATGLVSPTKETNPFKMDDDCIPANLIPESRELAVESQNSFNNDFMNTVDQFNSAVEEKVASDNYNQVSSTQEHVHLEPEATKTVSYQTLTPANEPQITKSDSYVTGEEEIKEALTTEEITPEVNKLEELDVSVVEKETVVDKLEPEPLVETKAPVLESVQKSEPVQSTTVTETLITALEETSEVPSVATTEVPSSAGTPPPTPAPGMDDSTEVQETPKTDVLVAAVAAAGAVAAGSAILAEKEAKKAKEVSTKKPAVGAKKPEVAGKLTTSKTTASKAPATKPAVSKTTNTTTTKTVGTAAKTATATARPAAAKTSAVSTAPKKPTAPAPAKPALAAATKQTTTGSKTVPKQLSLATKTTPTTTKSLTPNSKPTTPTTGKSPMLKSPSTKPAPRSPLVPKTSVKPAADKLAEKKPLTNGDIKPLKKSDVPKKTTTTTLSAKQPAAKPTLTSRTAASPKTASTATTNAPKPKPASALAPKPSTVGAKRPSTAPPAKPMNGKEAVSKLAPRTKPALNGKSSPKPLAGVKKTDSKPNATKTDVKPPPIRKPEEMKKVEQKQEEIQESPVTVPTTNGFADHNEDQESMKIEDLAPVTVEILN